MVPPKKQPITLAPPTNHKLERIAQRAAYLDEEGIDAIEGMLTYILKREGIDLPNEEPGEQTSH